MKETGITRRDAGVAELARLESVCTSKGYRGFESLSLRASCGYSLKNKILRMVGGSPLISQNN